MNDKYMSFDEVRFITEQKFNELGNGKLEDGDLICLLRGSVGKTRIFKSTGKYKTGFICAQMLIIRSIYVYLSDYIYLLISSPYYQSMIDSKVTGTAVRQLPAKEVAHILLPIPPINEQKKILQVINTIIPLANTL